MDLKIILAFLAIVCLTSGNPVANNPANDDGNDVTTSVECASGFGWCGNVQKCCYLGSKCGHVSPCSGPFPGPRRSSDVNIEETYDPALDANINEKETLPFEEQIEFE